MNINRALTLASASVAVVALNCFCLMASPRFEALSSEQTDAIFAGARRGTCNFPWTCQACVSRTQCVAVGVRVALPQGGFEVKPMCFPILDGNTGDGCANTMSVKKCNLACVWSTCPANTNSCGQKSDTGCNGYVPNPLPGEPHCSPFPCNPIARDCANCG